VRVIQAYRFALDPTPAQQAALRSHCGAQRFAFNWGLARVKANLSQREAERSYGVPEELLTPVVSWSGWQLRKDFNVAKREVAPWWAKNSKEAYASGLANPSGRAGELVGQSRRHQEGPQGWFSQVQGQAISSERAVHDGGIRARTAGPATCSTAEDRGCSYA